MFALAEAKALIIQHRDAVLAVARLDDSPHARRRHDSRDHRPRAGTRAARQVGTGSTERSRVRRACNGKLMSRTGEIMRLVWAIASGIGGTADIAHLGGHVAV